MSKVVSITPYQVLNRWEQQANRMLALAIRCNDEPLFTIAKALEVLHREMSDALQQGERARLEEQLRASLELIGRSLEQPSTESTNKNAG